jgi:hypothetical protein
MNERIKQLALQAKLIDSEYNGFDRTTITKSEQKFAELIVLESSKWIVDNSIAMEQLGPEFFAMGLCKHFGVK